MNPSTQRMEQDADATMTMDEYDGQYLFQDADYRKPVLKAQQATPPSKAL